MTETKTETKRPTLKGKRTDLKLSQVVKEAKSMYEQNSYELDNGQTITHFVQFPELEIEAMYEELQKHIKEMETIGIELSDKMNIYFIQTLIIKYFSHFGKDMGNNLLAEGKKAGLLDYLDYFANKGLLKLMMEEIFLPAEVNKAYEKVSDIFAVSRLIEEIQDKAEQKFQNLKIKNREILEQFDTENNNVSNVLADK